MKKYIAIAIITGLSACQSTTGPTTQPQPNNQQTATAQAKALSENLPANTEISFDPSTNTLTYVYTYANGRTTSESVIVDELSNGMSARLTSGSLPYAVAAGSASGGGTATAGTYYNNTITMERVGPTEVPTSGTARYTADYSGLMIVNGSRQPAIVGDVTLDANFNTGQIGGRISNRHREGLPSYTYDNVTLETTSLIDGEFYGQAEGGQSSYTSATYNDNGTYQGLITGANGDEIVGGVSLAHGTTGTETGIFASQ